MGFKITLAGDQGSGKSTVARLLVEQTGAAYHSAGQTARDMADEKGMDIAAFNLWTESHPEIDYEIDGRLVRLSDDPRDLIVDSRMAWRFVRGSFAVFLFADPVESARRILEAGRATETFLTLDDALSGVRRRRESEIKRYADLYGVNIKDPDNYDLSVDTTYASPAEVAAAILAAFADWQAGERQKRRLICPAHLSYPDDEPDHAALERHALSIELGRPLPPVTVSLCDGAYRVLRDPEVALAAAAAGLPHVPFVLSDAPLPEGVQFVKLENLTAC